MERLSVVNFFSYIYIYAYVYWVEKYNTSLTVCCMSKNAEEMMLYRDVERKQTGVCFRKKRLISVHKVDAGQWHFCLNVLKKIMTRNQSHPRIIKQHEFKNQLDFKTHLQISWVETNTG